MTQARRTNNDFDPDALTHKTDEHTKILDGLQKRVGTNENFGKTFAEAANDSKSIENALESVIVKLLQHNVDAREAISGIVGTMDGRQLRAQITAFAKVAAWAVSIIVAALVGAFINSKFRS